MFRAWALLGVLVVTTACNRGIDTENFEPLYRSGKEMTGATTVGVTLVRYRELLQHLATEIEIADDKAASANEKALITWYRQALVAFRDAETMWKTKIDMASVVPAGQPTPIYLSSGAEKFYGPLVETYNLQHLVNRERVITAEDMQQAMWAAASKSLDTGEAIYNGTPLPK